MALLTKRELIKGLNDGHFDLVLKELRRYGKIIRDKSWDCDDGFYKGSNRCFHVDYKNLLWRCLMINGEIIRLGYTVKFKG